jgi:hypothetical protein
MMNIMMPLMLGISASIWRPDSALLVDGQFHRHGTAVGHEPHRTGPRNRMMERARRKMSRWRLARGLLFLAKPDVLDDYRWKAAAWFPPFLPAATENAS